MIPSASELTYFLEIAQTLNMSRAAERLAISQPALTQAIQRLENSLGQPVLLRSKKGVTLTRAGEKLVSQARFLLDEWTKMKGEIAKDLQEVRGTYTLGCHPSVGLFTLARFLPSLMKEYPDFEVRLAHDLSRKITDDVLAFKVDFGIVVNPTPHPDLVLKLLLTDQVSFWVAPQSQDSQTLIYDPQLTQSQFLLKQLARRGNVFSRMVTSSNLEVILELVGSGMGVGILPGRVAGRCTTAKLKPWNPHQPAYEDKIYLAYRADAQRSKASKLIFQKIVESLK